MLPAYFESSMSVNGMEKGGYSAIDRLNILPFYAMVLGLPGSLLPGQL